MKEYANWKEIAKKIANKNEAIAGTQHYVPSGCRLCLDNPSGHNRMLPGCCQDAARMPYAARTQQAARILQATCGHQNTSGKPPERPPGCHLPPG